MLISFRWLYASCFLSACLAASLSCNLPGIAELRGMFCVGGGITSANGVPLHNIPHRFAKRADQTLLPSP